MSDVEEPYVLAAAMALLRQERGLDSAEIAKQVAIPMDLMEDFIVEQRPRLRVAAPPGS